MQRDTIIIMEGGAMLGVFGAGVVTACHQANIYPRLHSVYGASAGAHNLAYFLAAQHDPRQVPTGASIYYEDLIGRNFIKPGNFFRYFADLVIRRFNKQHRVRNIIDLDYLQQVESTNKKLDTVAITRQPIPFYISVYDLAEQTVKYINGGKSTLQALKASSSTPPYYAYTVTVEGRAYLDGDYVRNKMALEIIKQNPGKKIVYIINYKKTIFKTILATPADFLVALLSCLAFGWRTGLAPLRHRFGFVRISELKKYPNVSVVINDIRSQHSITTKDDLLRIYHHGQEKGGEVLKELGLA